MQKKLVKICRICTKICKTWICTGKSMAVGKCDMQRIWCTKICKICKISEQKCDMHWRDFAPSHPMMITGRPGLMRPGAGPWLSLSGRSVTVGPGLPSRAARDSAVNSPVTASARAACRRTEPASESPWLWPSSSESQDSIRVPCVALMVWNSRSSRWGPMPDFASDSDLGIRPAASAGTQALNHNSEPEAWQWCKTTLPLVKRSKPATKAPEASRSCPWSKFFVFTTKALIRTLCCGSCSKSTLRVNWT